MAESRYGRTVTRYVVTRPYPGSGIGSNLASLAGAVWIATRLERTLVVDWRGMDVLRDKRINVFTRYLDPVTEIDGVPVVYAGEAGVPDVGFPEDQVPGVLWADPDLAQSIARGQTPVDVPVLALQEYHGLERVAHWLDQSERDRRIRRVYERIAPAAELRGEIGDWLAANVGGRFVVGANVRTGNGDFARGSLPRTRVDVSILAEEEKFLRKLARACATRARGRDDYVIFFATDSAYGHGLLSRLPNAVTRRQRFPPPNAGVHVPAEDDEAALADTVIDMFLLARCDGLVYNFSMFSFYGRVVTDDYGGNALNIERAYGRFWLRALKRGVRGVGARTRRRVRRAHASR